MSTTIRLDAKTHKRLTVIAGHFQLEKKRSISLGEAVALLLEEKEGDLKQMADALKHAATEAKGEWKPDTVRQLEAAAKYYSSLVEDDKE